MMNKWHNPPAASSASPIITSPSEFKKLLKMSEYELWVAENTFSAKAVTAVIPSKKYPSCGFNSVYFRAKVTETYQQLVHGLMMEAFTPAEAMSLLIDHQQIMTVYNSAGEAISTISAAAALNNVKIESVETLTQPGQPFLNTSVLKTFTEATPRRDLPYSTSVTCSPYKGFAKQKYRYIASIVKNSISGDIEITFQPVADLERDNAIIEEFVALMREAGDPEKTFLGAIE